MKQRGQHSGKKRLNWGDYILLTTSLHHILLPGRGRDSPGLGGVGGVSAGGDALGK